MFSRPNISDSLYLIADFLEFKCLQSGSYISGLTCRSLLSISDDEINNEGVESSDDYSVEILDEAIGECYNRSQYCPQYYPFITGKGSLELKADASWYKDIYTFLLLVTRLNMNTQREQGGYDGTKLFEELCASVIKEYYGCHSQSKVFGTAEEGSFKDKVEDLIRSLHLNAAFKEPIGSTGKQKDGNLDIVVWIPFSDKKDGQMIAMGQCKTGTNWDEKLTEFSPESFFGCYTTSRPFSMPLRMFFVAESFGDYKWQERCINGGVLFDRTRIMEFLPPQLDAVLLDKIIAWNTSAMAEESSVED